MKSLLALAGVLAIAATSCTGDTTGPQVSDFDPPAALQQTGNGMESGAHYNLNIIGVEKDKTADMDNNNGRRIFVSLVWSNGRGGGKQAKETGITWDAVSKHNTILLCQAGVDPRCPDPDYKVMDANATDDDGAMFALPAPGSYKIYARALGKPAKSGEGATMRTCGWETDDELVSDASTGDVWCSMEALELERKKGKPKTIDATTYLTVIENLTVTELADPGLYTCLGGTDTDGDTGVLTEQDVEIFNPCFEHYFWDYDNNGLKLLQLRFYPM